MTLKRRSTLQKVYSVSLGWSAVMSSYFCLCNILLLSSCLTQVKIHWSVDWLSIFTRCTNICCWWCEYCCV